MRRALVAGLIAGLAGGCSPGADMTAAQGAIDTFHQELNAGSFEQIYTEASPRLKQATSDATLAQLLAAIHRKLGAFQSGKTAGWNDSVNLNGHFITLNYSATYARGPAMENFVFQVGGAKPLLVGYHINSTALILN